MKDLSFVDDFFSSLAAFWTIVSAIMGIIFIVLAFNGIGIAVIGALLTFAFWFVIVKTIKFQKIIFTRFVAATENIYEITVMMEEKLKQ